MKCNAFNESRCHSCEYLPDNYENSLKKKEEHFFNYIKEDQIQDYRPVVGLSQVSGSRNKAKLAISLQGEEICFGIVNQGMTFSKLEDCPLHIDGINEILLELKILFKKHKIIPYDLITKKGEAKFLLITKSDTTNEILLRVVLRSKESLDRFRFIKDEILLKFTNIIVFSINIQPDHKAILEGKEEIVLTSATSITHLYDNFRIHLGVKSFFQVTSVIARKLYLEVANFFKQNKIESLLDLYCGVGAFSFYSSRYVQFVKGVEISEDAIGFANKTKSENQLEHVKFESLDVDYFLKNNKDKFDAIIVNPPRRGVGEKGIQELLKLSPEYIVYSSCNALTLSSDFDLLKESYSIKTAQIFDMFPFSKHYEVLLILKKLN